MYKVFGTKRALNPYNWLINKFIIHKRYEKYFYSGSRE